MEKDVPLENFMYEKDDILERLYKETEGGYVGGSSEFIALPKPDKYRGKVMFDISNGTIVATPTVTDVCGQDLSGEILYKDATTN